MSDFDGLVAVVTGSASGIGAATTELLAARGATVVGLDLATDRDSGVSPRRGAARDTRGVGRHAHRRHPPPRHWVGVKLAGADDGFSALRAGAVDNAGVWINGRALVAFTASATAQVAVLPRDVCRCGCEGARRVPVEWS